MTDIENLLLNVALKSNMAHRYGCVITLRGKVIATGCNSLDTNKCCTSKQCFL